MVPEEVAKVFGAQPKELEVMFVSNDPTVNCPQGLRWYGESAGLQCIGNNQGGSSPESKTPGKLNPVLSMRKLGSENADHAQISSS